MGVRTVVTQMEDIAPRSRVTREGQHICSGARSLSVRIFGPTNGETSTGQQGETVRISKPSLSADRLPHIQKKHLTRNAVLSHHRARGVSVEQGGDETYGPSCSTVTSPQVMRKWTLFVKAG
jgi:hypothetical protein